MLVYAGIDEAGYGPMLGPLSIGASAFVIEGHDPADGAPNLWRLLARAVCRKRSDSRRRIAIDDSKRLKLPSSGRAHPLRHLERGVLGFEHAGRLLDSEDAAPIEDDNSFLTSVGATLEPQPWYESVSPLPLARTIGEARLDARRLTRAMSNAGIRLGTLRCEVIDAARFNDMVERQGRKSTVNLDAVMRHIAAIWSEWPDKHPRIVVDRQGGRTHYREDLSQAFPDTQIQVLAEQDGLSRYRLTSSQGPVTVTFTKAADSLHFPVALASMTAKYARELLMVRMNRFFQGRQPELKATAGYVEDARRYLTDIEPVIRELDLPRRALVRAI